MQKFAISFLVCFVCLIMSGLSVSAATSGKYTYTVSGGNATITDVDSSISGNIVIPSTLGGRSVTAIGDYAFEVCKKLKEVSIEGELASIGEYAFMENFALENVTYKGTNEPVIGECVFESCTLLKTITVSQNYEGETFGGYSVDKQEEVSVTITEDCSEVVVENLKEKVMLIVASYKGDTLTDCDVKEILGSGKHKLSDMTGADVIRVFIWKDLIEFIPVCKNAEYRE